MKQHQTVLVLDNGDGKCGQLTARALRQRRIYCEVAGSLPKGAAGKGYIGVIICGGGMTNEAEKTLLSLKVPLLAVSGMPENDEIEAFCKTCNVKGDWNMRDFADSEIESARNLYKGKKILCALSGGVDSSVCAMLLSKAVGKNLTCIFVDHGLMRKNEPDEVEAFFKKEDLNFIRIDAGERFLSKLRGVADPERKRKIIGEEFIRVFEEEAGKIGEVDYLVQGTIYPDIIESGIGKAGVIKSHHNVGGLPENIKFKGLIEPLKYLFKNEVRELGRVLGLDEKIAGRQPFPGPGLAVRILGEITKEKIVIVQNADWIFRQEIAAAGLDKEINQFFAALTDIRSVGVKNGKRTYDYAVALRAVTTSDFMTADFYRIPYAVLAKVSERIVNEVEGVNRVFYDITTKPPATIEFE